LTVVQHLFYTQKEGILIIEEEKTEENKTKMIKNIIKNAISKINKIG